MSQEQSACTASPTTQAQTCRTHIHQVQCVHIWNLAHRYGKMEGGGRSSSNSLHVSASFLQQQRPTERPCLKWWKLQSECKVSSNHDTHSLKNIFTFTFEVGRCVFTHTQRNQLFYQVFFNLLGIISSACPRHLLFVFIQIFI